MSMRGRMVINGREVTNPLVKFLVGASGVALGILAAVVVLALVIPFVGILVGGVIVLALVMSAVALVRRLLAGAVGPPAKHGRSGQEPDSDPDDDEAPRVIVVEGRKR